MEYFELRNPEAYRSFLLIFKPNTVIADAIYKTWPRNDLMSFTAAALRDKWVYKGKTWISPNGRRQIKFISKNMLEFRCVDISDHWYDIEFVNGPSGDYITIGIINPEWNTYRTTTYTINVSTVKKHLYGFVIGDGLDYLFKLL